MAYTPQTWNNNDPSTPLTATRLTYMEAGIQAANGAGTAGSVTNGVLLWNGSAWVNSLIGASSWNSASSIPIAGTHTQGEIVLNSAPTAGGFIGWVCVSSGTPGTWKTWGVISA